MNGARRIAEMLAQKRMFFAGLPAVAEENKREIDMLTLNAANLLPVELPWPGTPHSPLVLLETPNRQLIPFSPFDSSLSVPASRFMLIFSFNSGTEGCRTVEVSQGVAAGTPSEQIWCHSMISMSWITWPVSGTAATRRCPHLQTCKPGKTLHHHRQTEKDASLELCSYGLSSARS
jgi:hypothetical protein